MDPLSKVKTDLMEIIKEVYKEALQLAADYGRLGAVAFERGFKKHIGVEISTVLRALGPEEEVEQLLEGYRDDRMVLLPCKTKDPVWMIQDDEIIEAYIAQWIIDGTSNRAVIMKKSPFLFLQQTVVFLSNFGKTVFLNPEDAEVAIMKSMPLDPEITE